MFASFVVPAGAIEADLRRFLLTVAFDDVDASSIAVYCGQKLLDSEIRSTSPLRFVVRTDLKREEDNVFTVQY